MNRFSQSNWTFFVILCVMVLLLFGLSADYNGAGDEKASAEKESLAIQLLDIPVDETNQFEMESENTVVKDPSCKDTIRVLIRTSNFDNIFHARVMLSSDNGLLVVDPETETEILKTEPGEVLLIPQDLDFPAGERIQITPMDEEGKITIIGNERAYGYASYGGSLELLQTAYGFIVINELPLEDYLESVVPSEMPASYNTEALKAQAICARTYAYIHMLSPGYPDYGADVDDSTGYQVYNNIESDEKTSEAIKETEGCLLMTEKGTIAETYYYSTSCGSGADAGVWKSQYASSTEYLSPRYISKTNSQRSDALSDEEMFSSFIKETDINDYEVNENWYRWTYECNPDSKSIFEKMKECYKNTPNQILTYDGKEYESRKIGKAEKIKEIEVQSRRPGGAADELKITCEKHTFLILSGTNIRRILSVDGGKVTGQNGKAMKVGELLPSAFFVVETVKDKGNVIGCRLTGGGFGHGVGMSQNGANRMAEDGRTAEEILQFFFPSCKVVKKY